MSSLLGSSSKSPKVGTATGLKGSGYQSGTVQQFSPEQMKLFKQMFSQVGPESYLGKLAGGDEQTFNQLEAPAMKQFGQIQSGIANRFSGAGLGGRHSSGFQNAQNTASSDFASQLQAQRMGLQRNAINDLMSNSATLLGQRPQENFLVQKQQKPMSFWQQLLLGASERGAQMAGQAGTAALMF